MAVQEKLPSKGAVLITGGAGYIGSHMVRSILGKGISPIIFDNLSIGHEEFVPEGVPFYRGDLRNYDQIRQAFHRHSIESVVHFAACALVGESTENPLKYYENNVLGSINLIKAMIENGVRNIVFSSSCSVYGNQTNDHIREEDPLRPVNPYGRTKLMVEQIISEVAHKENLAYIFLRYFNVAGAHSSENIGEWHSPETHLIPNILSAAFRKTTPFSLYGNDYPTPDGTCIRDYVHVEDLCQAHLKALTALQNESARNEAFNLGSGCGYSILEVLESARRISGVDIKTSVKERREGDPPKLVASNDKAREKLSWEPRRNLEDMIRSAWRWTATMGSKGLIA